jgi:hypothetical protein
MKLMSNEEIDTILKSCYGEDLGYNSDDAEYEYYSKLKDKSNNQDTMDIAGQFTNRKHYITTFAFKKNFSVNIPRV